MYPSLHKTNIFEPSACISPDDLRLYGAHKLRGRNLRAVEEHLADCELCSLAADGFLLTAVTAADLQELHVRIDSVAGTSWFASWGRYVILSFSVLALTAASIWLLSGKKRPLTSASYGSHALGFPSAFAWLVHAATPSAVLHPEAMNSNKKDGESENGLTTVQTENFIQVPVVKQNTSGKTTQVQSFNADNYANSNSVTNPRNMAGNTFSNPGNNPLESNSAFVSSLSNDNNNNEVLVLPEYNKPVQYLYTLKVSEYNELYFHAPVASVSHGTPSPQETKQPGISNAVFADESHAQRADVILKDALLYFNNANYGGALAKFRILLDVNAKDVNALFYTGICYYRMNLPEKCIASLDKSLLSEDNAFHEESLWYKALALFMKGDKTSAREILSEIVKGRGYYAKQAKEKLKELK